MAAPTQVRAEAILEGTVILRWLPTQARTLDVYRSIDGTTYAVVASIDKLDDVQYVDEGLANKTKYWYKLSDDVGATFSAVVTVVTYSITASVISATAQIPINLTSTEELQWHLRELDNKNTHENDPCDLCILDGALVLNCGSGCNWFRVVVDQDINSISIIGCEDCPPVDFVIPAGATRSICGWPMGCEYTRDECFDAPLYGGLLGRTAKTNGLSYGGYGGMGGGGRLKVETCPCKSALDITAQHTFGCITDCLRIQCCENNCALACGQTTKLKACGGLAPYTWTKTGSVTLSAGKAGVTNKVTSTKVPVGNTPGVFPTTTAYGKATLNSGGIGSMDNGCGGQTFNVSNLIAGARMTSLYNCDFTEITNLAGQQSSGCFGLSHVCNNVSYTDLGNLCDGSNAHVVNINCAVGITLGFQLPGSTITGDSSGYFTPIGSGNGSGCPGAATGSWGFSMVIPSSPGVFNTNMGTTGFIDLRNQAMRDAGCGDSCDQGATTVTVTDAAGATSTIVLAV